jgi:hypothetical protein
VNPERPNAPHPASHSRREFLGRTTRGEDICFVTAARSSSPLAGEDTGEGESVANLSVCSVVKRNPRLRPNQTKSNRIKPRKNNQPSAISFPACGGEARQGRQPSTESTGTDQFNRKPVLLPLGITPSGVSVVLRLCRTGRIGINATREKNGVRVVSIMWGSEINDLGCILTLPPL